MVPGVRASGGERSPQQLALRLCVLEPRGELLVALALLRGSLAAALERAGRVRGSRLQRADQIGACRARGVAA